MNPKLKELFDKAADSAHDHIETNAGGITEFNSAYMEKTAELIFKACIDNLEWHGRDEKAISQLIWLAGSFGIRIKNGS